ncbi:hypothetical protein JQ628_02355 [Bradyrhizobium lablabi]|nr:hypothetical protein [Bradyrhizobium lablabi]MBR1120342.1 hypothetical protein [Bradyrhizobium lablabi]
MKAERRDAPRRLTPELLAFYKLRAKQLRDQAYVDAVSAVWAWLKRLARR